MRRLVDWASNTFGYSRSLSSSNVADFGDVGLQRESISHAVDSTAVRSGPRSAMSLTNTSASTPSNHTWDSGCPPAPVLLTENPSSTPLLLDQDHT